MNWLRTLRQRWRIGRARFDDQFFHPDEPFHLLSTRGSPLWKASWFYVWDYPLTAGGKILVLGFSLSFLFGAISVDVPLYQLFLALLVLTLVTSTVGSVFRWVPVEVTGSFPDEITAGQTLVGKFIASNKGKWPVFDVSASCFLPPRGWRLEWDSGMHPTIPGGESAEFTVRLTPFCRGQYRLPPVRVYSTFPLNLNRNQLSRTGSHTVLVTPRFHPLTSVNLQVGRRYQPGGLALTSNIGESPEYIGNREYQPGDPLRRVDFRSWARLARPVVREYQEEYYCRIALVLDTYIAPRRLRPATGFPELEAAVSLAASVGEALSRGEYIIDLFAAGPELHVFRAGRHTAHLSQVLEILAGVGPCRQTPFAKLTPALVNELTQISSVVCVFLDWDEERQLLVRSACEAGCSVKVLVVRDKPPSRPFVVEGPVDLKLLAPEQVFSGKLESL